MSECRGIFAVCPVGGCGQCPACEREDRIWELEAENATGKEMFKKRGEYMDELQATIAERDAQLKFIRIGYEVLVQTGQRHALDAALEKKDEVEVEVEIPMPFL